MQGGEQTDERVQTNDVEEVNNNNVREVQEEENEGEGSQETTEIEECPVKFRDFRSIVFVWNTEDLDDLRIIQKVVAKGCVRLKRVSKSVNVLVVKSKEEVVFDKKPFKGILESGREVVFALPSWFKEIAKESIKDPPNSTDYFVAPTHNSKSFYFFCKCISL